MQAKLLHVLQDGQFNRLGARESSRVDVRVLAATNVQIESALVGKTFREDLYYRLNVFTINVPPLRERREEIPYLIEETIRRSPEMLRQRYDFNFSSRLMDAVLLYDWRGNVRELAEFCYPHYHHARPGYGDQGTGDEDRCRGSRGSGRAEWFHRCPSKTGYALCCARHEGPGRGTDDPGCAGSFRMEPAPCGQVSEHQLSRPALQDPAAPARAEASSWSRPA